MSRELVRLTGDEEWDAWGDDWSRHVDKIADLQLFGSESYYGPPEWMRQHPRRQLDWGATLYEASKDDVVRLLMEAPPRQGSPHHDSRGVCGVCRGFGPPNERGGQKSTTDDAERALLAGGSR